MPRTGPAIRSITTPSIRRAATPNSIPSSPSYRQHHDVTAPRIDPTAFRPGWLVQTRLWSLFDSGRIERDGLDAALTWKRWAELVRGLKVQSWEIRVDQAVAPSRSDNGVARRIDAAGKLRMVAQALGPLRVAILEACVPDDTSWARLARLLRVSDKTSRDRAAEAITALAAWQAGDPVPPAPEVRFRNQPSSW